MLEVVATLGWREAVEKCGDRRFKFLDGASGGFAEQAFEFGESPFDRVQIGTVGRQVLKRSADSFDRFADSSHLVGGQIVENQDITWLKRWCELLLHIGQEDRAVHRSIDDQRGRKSAGPQRRNKRRCFPVSMRHMIDQTMSPPGASEAASHLRVGACFIEKHQPPVVDPGPPELPANATINYVGTLLLSRMQDFFLA